MTCTHHCRSSSPYTQMYNCSDILLWNHDISHAYMVNHCIWRLSQKIILKTKWFSFAKIIIYFDPNQVHYLFKKSCQVRNKITFRITFNTVGSCISQTTVTEVASWCVQTVPVHAWCIFTGSHWKLIHLGD